MELKRNQSSSSSLPGQFVQVSDNPVIYKKRKQLSLNLNILEEQPFQKRITLKTPKQSQQMLHVIDAEEKKNAGATSSGKKKKRKRVKVSMSINSKGSGGLSAINNINLLQADNDGICQFLEAEYRKNFNWRDEGKANLNGSLIEKIRQFNSKKSQLKPVVDMTVGQKQNRKFDENSHKLVGLHKKKPSISNALKALPVAASLPVEVNGFQERKNQVFLQFARLQHRVQSQIFAKIRQTCALVSPDATTTPKGVNFGIADKLPQFERQEIEHRAWENLNKQHVTSEEDAITTKSVSQKDSSQSILSQPPLKYNSQKIAGATISTSLPVSFEISNKVTNQLLQSPQGVHVFPLKNERLKEELFKGLEVSSSLPEKSSEFQHSDQQNQSQIDISQESSQQISFSSSKVNDSSSKKIQNYSESKDNLRVSQDSNDQLVWITRQQVLEGKALSGQSIQYSDNKFFKNEYYSQQQMNSVRYKAAYNQLSPPQVLSAEDFIGNETDESLRFMKSSEPIRSKENSVQEEHGNELSSGLIQINRIPTVQSDGSAEEEFDQRAYFDMAATFIQKIWRGYLTRRLIFEFYEQMQEQFEQEKGGMLNKVAFKEEKEEDNSLLCREQEEIKESKQQRSQKDNEIEKRNKQKQKLQNIISFEGKHQQQSQQQQQPQEKVYNVMDSARRCREEFERMKEQQVAKWDELMRDFIKLASSKQNEISQEAFQAIYSRLEANKNQLLQGEDKGEDTNSGNKEIVDKSQVVKDSDLPERNSLTQYNSNYYSQNRSIQL